MAPSIAQESPNTDELNRIAELKIKHAYSETQHSTVGYQLVEIR
jgi:hypothetical protein